MTQLMQGLIVNLDPKASDLTCIAQQCSTGSKASYSRTLDDDYTMPGYADLHGGSFVRHRGMMILSASDFNAEIFSRPA